MSLPYIPLRPQEVGPVTIHPFGIMVAIGVITGWRLCHRYRERHGMSLDVAKTLFPVTVAAGAIGAHVINTLFYEPDKPLWKLWDGLSSYGGFAGAFAGFSVYMLFRPQLNWRRWADVAVYGFVPGFWFGRVGCSIAHDHIGRATDFPLAVNFPPEIHNLIPAGGMHHDLGLYEALFLMPVVFAVVYLVARKRNRPDGLLLATACLVYSVPRFFLDYLRLEAPDPRLHGFTAAQFFSIAMFVSGCYFMFRFYVQKQFTLAPDPDEVARLAAEQAAEQAADAAAREGKAEAGRGKGQKPAKAVARKKKKRKKR